jgi:D-alanyl-D-alanine carboxypeptidase
MFVGTQVRAQDNAQYIANFIKNNPDKVSIYLLRNDTVLIAQQENRMMPLASTVKLIVAVEFVKQAGAGIIDTAALVALSDLEKHYIPNTDGAAHPSWLKRLRADEKIYNDSVKLIDIARGMIQYSSNANTDYLMDYLGIQQVNSNLSLLNLKQHTPIYPLVGALFLYQNPKNKKEESVLKSISKLKDEEYAHYAYSMHKALKNGDKLKASFRPMDLTIQMQRMWSDRLPASTVKMYAQLGNILNKRAFLSKPAYGVLAKVTETLMENPNNQEWLQHAGMKGGSTAFVLTKSLYATLKDGTRIEVAYFMNNLTFRQVNDLRNKLNDFETSLLSEPEFLQSFCELLKP